MANTVDKVIKIALAEVGYLEKRSNLMLDDKTANAGSANYTKYGRDMHKVYPSVMDFPAAWCDAFVDWCFYKAYGVSTAKSLLCGNFDDYTVASAQMYKNKKAWHTSPKVGDQIFFTNSKGGICHTGLVYAVNNGKVYTVEGNTSGASGVIANGGGVCKKSYSLNYSRIAGYGRPKYEGNIDTTINVEAVTVDITLNQLSKGSKGKQVKTLQRLLQAMGYSVGSYGADGDFGGSTLAAVKDFQSENGLTVDGIVGKATWTKLLK